MSASEEQNKLSMLVSETAKYYRINPSLALSEEFFRLWETNCVPESFCLPPDGLSIDGKELFRAEDYAAGKSPIIHTCWNDTEHAPWIVCEYSDIDAVTRLMRVDETGVRLEEGPAVPNALEERLQGENIEAMAEVVTALKKAYPNLPLTTLKNKDSLIRSTLIKLNQRKKKSIYARLQRFRSDDRRKLFERVLSDMAEDEISSQLTLGLELEADSPVAEAQPLEELIPGTIPARGTLIPRQEMELLLEAQVEQKKCEDDFYFSFADAVPLTPLTDGVKQGVRLPFKSDSYTGLREGSRLVIFQEGHPRQTLGTLSIDVLEESEILGTVQWSEPGFVLPLDGHVWAMPRKGPQEFLNQLLADTYERLFGKAPAPEEELTAVRAALGLTAATYVSPFEEKRPEYPWLDKSQAKAALTCLDERNPIVLVQGPPGTGKTRVLEQVVRELAAQGKRILLTAPSNTAVDNVARRLTNLPMLRHASVADSVAYDLRNTHWAGNEKACREFQQKSAAMHCAIHAGTHVGLLRSLVVAKEFAEYGEFDAVVFDEAGMSSTSEALLCLGLGKRGLFFGDIQQLPPFPLPQAAWDRLSERHPAMTHSQRLFLANGLLAWLQRAQEFMVILLQTSHRCQNPRLIRFASLLFYNGQVQTDSDAEYYRMSYKDRIRQFPADTLKFIATSKLPEDVRSERLDLEGCQPGFDNPTEAKIVRQLVVDGMKRYPMKEITVISPYRKQVKLIRHLLEDVPHECDDAEWDKYLHERIATVDSFQGGESDMVIISYVRSGGSGVGFIDDPNRVNVTHTRSRREMIVVGDLDFLATHANNRIFERMARSFERDGIVEYIRSIDD